MIYGIYLLLLLIIMAEFQHKQIPFALKGVCLTRAIDFIPDGRVTIARNIRSYQEGIVQSRSGQTAINNSAIADLNIHSIKRLNNDIPGATQAYSLIIAAGTSLYNDNGAHNAFTSRASGFSGSPLSIIPFRPNASPEPFAYIADSSKMVKMNIDGSKVRNIGIFPPTTYPKGPSGAAMPALNSFQFTTIDSGIVSAAGWAAGTGIFSVTNATGPTDTIAGIIYDSGSTGWASIGVTAPTDTRFWQVGAMVTTNTSAETIILDSVYTPIKTTTISSITYDSGTTGLCTIVLASHKRKALVPNVLILLNASEYVRVISVTWGDDDLPSLRCSTAGTFSAGQSVTGVNSWRAFFANVHAAAETYTWKVLTITGNVVAANTSVVAYATKTGALDLSNVGGRPIQDSDEINFEIYLNDSFASGGGVGLIQEVQIQLDVDDATFTRNYYYIAIHPSSLSPVITGQQTVQNARTNKLTEDIINTVDIPSDQSTAQLRQKLQRRLAKAQRNANENRARKLLNRLNNLPIDDIPGGGDVINPNPPSNSIPNTSGGVIPTVGLNSYIPIRIKVSDLQRVGSDLTKTLANVGVIGIRVIANNTTSVASVAGDFALNFGSFWIGGAYGPDAGIAGTPYLYRFRYRASETGARSFPSPSTRSGVIARRQRVQLSAAASSDAQVDKIDWFRFGGSINVWKYIGTGANSTATFNDDFPDDSILNNEELTFEDFQPFPIVSTPITGTCTVSGTMVTVTSGAVSISMAAGTQIIINGISCTLYAPPISTTKFEIVESIGALSGVSLFIPEPLLIGQPLPAMWGPFGQGFLGTVMFACGDNYNPGTLYWTNPDDPDSASDRNQLEITSPSEPLMNGFLYNNTSYVFSSEDLYVIYPTSDITGRLTFKANKTGLGLGLAGRYSYCVGEGRIWFVSRDGIYTTEGSIPVSITDDDLYPLFPHDGLVGTGVNGYIAPDYTSPNTLRLSIGDSILRFDFKGTDTNYYTWLYDINTKSWLFDSYGRQIITSYYEEGKNTHRWLMGAINGKLYQYGGTSDDTIAIACEVRSKVENFGDSRLEKIIAEHYLDFDPDGATITVQPGFDNYTVLPTPTTLVTTAGRRQQVIDIASGVGTLARNVTNDITWSSTTAVPKLYLFDYYFLVKVDNTYQRYTDYTDLGYSGPKYIRGFRLRADTANVARNIRIEYDGTAIGVDVVVQHNGELWKSYDIPTPFMAYLVRIAPQDALLWRLYDIEFIYDKYPDLDNIITGWTDGGYLGDKWLQGIVLRADSNNVATTVLVKSDDGNTIATLSCTHNGDQTKPYSWEPYRTHEMRLVPQGNIRIIDAKWIYEPEAELTNFWKAQPQSFGMDGFLHIKSCQIPLISTSIVTLTINIDGVDYTYDIPSTADIFKKNYISLQAIKGKVFQLFLEPKVGTTGFRVYQKDIEFKIKAWGSNSGYLTVKPLGHPHAVNGALI